MNYDQRELVGKPSSIFLEIDKNKDGTTPDRVPAIIQYVFDGTVILKIKFKPKNWEETLERSCQFILKLEAHQEPIKIKGVVTWTSFMEEGKRSLYLIGMKLAEVNLPLRKTLEDLIPPNARDIKELWRQWDEAQGISSAWPNNKIYVLILALVVIGIAFLFIGQKIFK